MQHGIETVKSTFQKLLIDDGNLEASIELFNKLRAEEKLSHEDTGWILWNICDGYAMRRDAQNQFPYQSEFYKWVNAHFYPERLHWVVSDGTQARILIDGGYLYPWWQWYLYANEHAPRVEQNRNARFESHRATADALTFFTEYEKAEVPLKALDDLLEEDSAWTNYDFAEVTFRTILIDFYNGTGQTGLLHHTASQMIRYLDKWDSQPPAQPATSGLLLGSWEQINSGLGAQALPVAVHNAACALALTDLTSQAEVLFRKIIQQGDLPTSYGQALFLLSCWKNRHDRQEIKELLTTFKRLTPEKLLKFAPEIAVLADEMHTEDDD
jgi:hypothetical protein